ncbi:MAG: c-type cytochrome domain-containing protein [Planctomycetota bacterium]
MRIIASIILLLLTQSIVCQSCRAAETVDYVKDVLPVFQKYCIGCHTEDEQQGGLVMESHRALMLGGDSGLSITAGEASSSRLVLMMRGTLEPAMPPEGEARPTEKEIQIVESWVEQGALGPDGDVPLKLELKVPSFATAKGVKRPITALAVSGEGPRAIARYGEIEIQDRDGKTLSKMTADLNKVNSIQFSRDGQRLLVASGVPGAYGFAAIFDVSSGAREMELLGHRDIVYAAEFSPDESLVATAGYDRRILLWDAQSGELIRELTGHNGAVFDLAFSPNGRVLMSACADETVKVWQVKTGERLDTLSQPEGEVFAVDVTPDGKFILAGSSDNRLRVWKLVSTVRPRINPLIATRFVDESPLVGMTLTPDGNRLAVLSMAGNLKLIRTKDWNLSDTLEPFKETGSDLAVAPDGQHLFVSLMSGDVIQREIPETRSIQAVAETGLMPIYMDLGPTKEWKESDLGGNPESGDPVAVGRNVEIRGKLDHPAQSDRFQFEARRGEVWAIDADPVDKSPLDPIVSIYDEQGQPVLQTRLQAIRDSYFTFRGKDSNQIGDFRVFNWQEMRLNDYFFAAGEVTRLYMYPRGPDSGYNVYPNEGKRWTYFGTSHTTHALGEPGYIVRPLAMDETPLANGLPVFDIFYENDDDPMRLAGKSSRLLFTAPDNAKYTVVIRDTRGDGGAGFDYKLAIRPANPSFKASIGKPNATLRRGVGREFTVRIDRMDGFDGSVTFDIPDLPPEIRSNLPITIEPGQRSARGSLWVAEDVQAWEGKISLDVHARGEVLGRVVERNLGSIGELTLGDRPNAIPSIQPIDRTVEEDENWTLTVRRGETVSARVVIRRKDGFVNEVSFGKENAGRNTAHGVYVDNIGLSGLLVRRDETEREFFLTADPITKPGKRTFFLTGAVDGNVTTHPITVEVLP